MIAYDYMKQRTEANRKDGVQTMPTIVGIDYDSGWVMAHMVQKKGFDKYAVGCMVRDVEQSGYNRVIIKGDQENSIKDVISAVRRERAEYIELMPEQSSVGEQQENGKVERAIQTVEGQVVTMRLALEHRYKCTIDENHPIWPWMVTHAAMCYNICHVGTDGRTPWERRKGRKFHRELPDFGESRPLSVARINRTGQSRIQMGGICAVCGSQATIGRTHIADQTRSN